MTEREQFEAWARSVGWPHYAAMPVTKGPDFFSNSSWDVWQAARAQPAQAGQVLTDAELAALMPPPDIDGSKARSPNAVRLAMRAVESAVLAKRVPMTDAQIEHALRSEPMVDSEESFALGIRAAERHHGIGDKP